jgi:putative hydrolase of HD superfamily
VESLQLLEPAEAARRTKVKAITVIVQENGEGWPILSFLKSIIKMKAIPRSGWLSHGISLHDVESVADHTFSTCALSLLLADLEIERGESVSMERVLRMALLHDMSESLTFDISKAYLEYLGRRGHAIKSELERAAWKHLADGLMNPALARNYTRLQSEFDSENTRESKIVHGADLLDILLQVIEYRRRGYPESLVADLWNGTGSRLKETNIPSVRKVHRMIIDEATKLRSN